MHLTPASPTLLHTITLILIIFFSLFSPSTAQASTARGMALAEQLMLQGKPLASDKAPYRSILKEKAFPLSSLPPPSRDGFSVYALESDFTDRGEVPGAWRAPGEPMHCYVDDGAMVVRRLVKAPKKKGVYRYRWTLSSPGSAEALIEWEYRVLSPDYARLLVRVNGGASRGVYGGEPVGSLDLTSGISPSLLFRTMDDDLTERMCIGTWTVREEMEKNPDIAGEFDMRMLAVREVSLSPRQFDPRGGEPSITFKARLEALPAVSRLTSSPWIPASPQWRIAALKEHNEGAFLVHRAWGSSTPVEHSWSGRADGTRGTPEPGSYRVLMQGIAKIGGQWVKSQFRGGNLTILPSPRIRVVNEKGEPVADSEELRLLSSYREGQQGEKAEPPPSITFIPSGQGITLPPPARSLQGGLLCASIYQKSLLKDELLTFTVEGLPKRVTTVRLTVHSNLPGREERTHSWVRKSSEEPASTRLLVTGEQKHARDHLLIGRDPAGEKSFAFMDLTYPEDTLAMKDLLQKRGWCSHGEYQMATPLSHPLKVNGKDFLRSAGYETLSITCPELPDIKALLHIKNQAQLLYYGGHGWGNGYIALDRGYIYPEEDIVEGDWSDNLQVVIFSSCSNLDIQNYNGWKFTAMGVVKNSPGIAWEQVAGPKVALLGYNWSTQEGKPPNAFDTKVIRRFLSLSGSHTPPVAWLYANIAEGDTVAPCAIYRNVYYFIHAATSRILAVPREEWRNSTLPKDAQSIPWPR